MGVVLGVVAAISGIVSTVATVQSVREGKKARRAQEAQNRKVKAVNESKADVARRRAIRTQRVQRAQLLAQAQAGGFGGSSTAISGEGKTQGIAASTASQVGNALATTNSLSKGNQAVQDSLDRQKLFATIAQVGQTVFNQSGGLDRLASGGGMFDFSKDKG